MVGMIQKVDTPGSSKGAYILVEEDRALVFAFEYPLSKAWAGAEAVARAVPGGTAVRHACTWAAQAEYFRTYLCVFWVSLMQTLQAWLGKLLFGLREHALELGVSYVRSHNANTVHTHGLPTMKGDADKQRQTGCKPRKAGIGVVPWPTIAPP